MVFGAVGTIGGLGWYIFKTRYDFHIAGTFAALLTIMVVGILIEEVLFKSLEKATVKKWGMSI
jgi:NitT/TauT family transport system permease protein